MIGGGREYMARMIPQNTKKDMGADITDAELLTMEEDGAGVEEIAERVKLTAVMVRVRLRRAKARRRR